MKKLISLLLILIACSSAMFAAYQAETYTVYGKNGIPMPDWARTMYYPDDEYHYVVASYKMPTRQASIARAEAACATELAMQIGIAAEVLVEDFMQVAGEGGTGNYQQLDYFVQATRQKSNTMLSGLVRFDVWEASDGEVYVLMGIPLENMKAGFENVLNESFSKDKEFVNNKAAQEAKNQFREFMSTDFANAFSSATATSAGQ